jgi:hypothetical protein
MRKYAAIACFLIIFCGISLAGGPSMKGGGSSKPQYYTYDDLVQYCKDVAYDFHCDQSVKPSEAMAYLPSYPYNEVTAVARYKKTLSERAQGIRPAEIGFNWDEHRNHLSKGTLVFQRSNSWVGRCEQFFSSFTHVSLVYDQYDQTVLESLIYTDQNGVQHNGVGVYSPSQSWAGIVTLSIKEINNPPAAGALTENANRLYAGKPYFPKVSTVLDILNFYTRWSDKYNQESMYCSKLVWWTFINGGIDLDSNATCSMVNNNMMFGNTNEPYLGWIGVSPDDIYYSRYLGQDLYLEGEENLCQIVFPLF